MNNLHEKCWSSLDSDWTSKTRDQQVSIQIRKYHCCDFQTLSLSSLKMVLVFSVVIDHREKNLWLFWLLLVPPPIIARHWLQSSTPESLHSCTKCSAGSDSQAGLNSCFQCQLELCWCIGNIFLGKVLYNYYIIATVGLLMQCLLEAMNTEKHSSLWGLLLNSNLLFHGPRRDMLTLLQPVIQFLSFTPCSQSCPWTGAMDVHRGSFSILHQDPLTAASVTHFPVALGDPFPWNLGLRMKGRWVRKAVNVTAGSSSHRSGKRRCSGTLRLLGGNDQQV